MSIVPSEVVRLSLGTTVAAMSLGTAFAQPPANVPTKVALHAGVGEALITFGLDVDRATLTRQSSVMLPGFVQEAWASPSHTVSLRRLEQRRRQLCRLGRRTRWETGTASPSFASTPTAPCASTVRAAPLRSRPIHITGDGPGRYLLVAYNEPSGVSVHAIDPDGSMGAEVRHVTSLDAGVYAHQVRVLPSNRAVVLVTRGNEPTASSREDPGALKVFRYDSGALSNRNLHRATERHSASAHAISISTRRVRGYS